jgi:hypothetical protein
MKNRQQSRMTPSVAMPIRGIFERLGQFLKKGQEVRRESLATTLEDGSAPGLHPMHLTNCDGVGSSALAQTDTVQWDLDSASKE